MKPENRVPEREVMCMNEECGHRFRSYVKTPRCYKCRSRRVENLEDVPRTYGGQELINLKKEFIDFKKYSTQVSSLLLKRIKALENALEAI